MDENLSPLQTLELRQLRRSWREQTQKQQNRHLLVVQLHSPQCPQPWLRVPARHVSTTRECPSAGPVCAQILVVYTL